MRFKGNYSFLSNFSFCNLVMSMEPNGPELVFSSAEAAYQAHKCPERAADFVDLKPEEARKLGHMFKLPPDWEDRKLKVMRDVIYQKFRQNPVLLNRLLCTVGTEIVNDNPWADKFWGVVDGEGKNHLGRILMEVRSGMVHEFEPGQVVYAHRNGITLAYKVRSVRPSTSSFSTEGNLYNLLQVGDYDKQTVLPETALSARPPAWYKCPMRCSLVPFARIDPASFASKAREKNLYLVNGPDRDGMCLISTSLVDKDAPTAKVSFNDIGTVFSVSREELEEVGDRA